MKQKTTNNLIVAYLIPLIFSLCRLTDETKKLILHTVYNDKVYRIGINVNDVTLVDTLNVLYVYIGPGSSDNEKANVWSQADVCVPANKANWRLVTK